MDSPLRSFSRIVVYVSLTLLLIPVQAIAMACRLPQARTIPFYYHRICCRILGIEVERRGTMSAERPVLFVVNHASYLDIMVLGSILRASFVAKREVAGWPLFGLLARLQRTVFVDRSVGQTAAQRDLIVRRLEAGDALILFPEGTSSDGNRVLPFKSALLSVAEAEIRGRPVAVQPVTVAYTRLDGMPLGRTLRPFFAWYGDMDLASHLGRMAGFGKLTVVVEFHPPVTVATVGSRKALARHCRDTVARGLAAAISGRLRPLEQAADAGGPA